jgi:hypothetical protein
MKTVVRHDLGVGHLSNGRTAEAGGDLKHCGPVSEHSQP